MAKRLYKLNYEATDRPVFVEDAGHLLKAAGILYQGMGSSILLLSPTADCDFVDPGLCVTEIWFNNHKDRITVVVPTLEEWCAVLEQTDDPVFFQNNEAWNAKAVVRKQQYAISGGVQWAIFERDGFRCMYCGKKGGREAGPLTVDHFVPLEKGGGDLADNYLTCCRRCNKRKGNIPPEKFCADNNLDFSGLRDFLDGKCSALFIAHLA